MNTIAFLVGGCSFEWRYSFQSLNYIINEINKDKRNPPTISNVYYLDLENQLFVLNYKQNVQVITPEYCVAQSVEYRASQLPDILRHKEDYLYSLIQGQQGEDGVLQALIQFAQCDSNLDPVLTAALTMNKSMQSIVANQYAESCLSAIPSVGLDSQTPISAPLRQELIEKFRHTTCILKPNNLGGSLLVEQHEDLDDNKLLSYQQKVKDYDRQFLVQQKIVGQEISCNCLVTDTGLQLLPMFVVNQIGALMDYAEKFERHQYRWEHFKPSDANKFMINKVCHQLYDALQFKQICRFDFILAGDKLYLLELNLMPSLYQFSLLQRALTLANISVRDFVFLAKSQSQQDFAVEHHQKISIKHHTNA